MNQTNHCSSCRLQIQSPSYVVRKKENEEVYYHIYCYYPNLLKNYQKLTKLYAYYALKDLTQLNSEPDQYHLSLSPIDFLIQSLDLVSDDPDEGEFDENLPSAA